ncbi:hypothetical protein SimranZ1_82 [Mycobacterium phage SimranZ1]|nr:hypothetical protein SimranZ1_82 [Mycobacterium phage SimranZ1]
MSLRCDVCGKFCKQLYDVWCNPYWNGIDHEACADCAGGGGSMSDGKRCARCGRADSVFGSWTYFVAPDRMRTVYLCHANQDGAKADPDCYHLATTLRDPMPDHYDQNPGEEA